MRWYKRINWLKLIIGITVLLVVLVVLTEVGKTPEKQSKSVKEKVQSVVVKKVVSKDLVINHEYIGYIEDASIYVGADRVQGKVNKVVVSEGDRVKEGCTLFTMDVSAELANTRFQSSEICNATGLLDLKIKQVSKTVKDLKELYEAGGIQLSEVEEVENQLETMKLQRKQLSRQGKILASTKSVIRNQAKVLSPIDGIVEEVNISPKTYIGQRDMIKIRKNQLPTCYIMVAESDIDRFVIDKKVKTVIGDSVYDGIIKEIRSRDEQRLLFPVKIEIDTKEHLLAGKSATVKLEVYNNKNARMIPKKSVIQFANETFVYVLNKDKTVVKKSIELGKSKDNMAEVLRGLTADDEVLVEGQFSVTEGEKVLLANQ